MKLLLTLLLIPCLSFGQYKIGELTIDKETFTKYILDCYRQPDTLRSKSFYDYIDCNSCSVPQTSIDRFKVVAEEYNSYLEKNKIGMCCYGKYLIPRKPTEADFIKWVKKQKR